MLVVIAPLPPVDCFNINNSSIPSVVVTPPDTDQSISTDNKKPALNHPTIPTFFYPFGKPSSPAEQQDRHRKILAIVRHLYGLRTYLLESHFVAVTKTCGLPRYMNIAFFRRIDSMHQREERVTFDQFLSGWTDLSRGRHDDDSLIFNILKKPGCAWLLPEDFLSVLEDIVLNHPGLRFLADNPMFQERYIETVICRLYYEARCPSGRMSLTQFRKSGFTRMIHALGPNVDLNSTRDCFSYKHFYVLYCKFWALDDDHDLIISESDLAKYNQAALTPRVVQRVIKCGRIAGFARDQSGSPRNTLTYLDYIWFLISEVDKSTPMAIEYWFRCLDTDGDGVLSGYELSLFWQEQEARQRFYGIAEEDQIRFDDILRQMNDLIQPRVPGQFRLSDLKRNGYLAERFFDTFMSFDRFQIHESYQGCIRAKREQALEKRRQLIEESVVPSEEEAMMMDNSLGLFLLSDWCEYAEKEYHQLLQNENTWEDQEEDDDGDEEDEDYEQPQEEEEEDEDDEETQEEEEEQAETETPPSEESDEEDESKADETSSDHESDTSTPTTPTKDPSPGSPGWQPGSSPPPNPETKTRNATISTWSWQEADAEQHQQDSEEEEREDRAAEWIWWLSRQRLSTPETQ